MNRSDLQRLADLRLRDAEALFAARAFEGAYYLAGYVVECALKACIARQVREFDFPEKRVVERSHTHNLVQLLDVAGLKADLDEDTVIDPELRSKWGIVSRWAETSRYTLDVTEAAAQNMLGAVADEAHGVLVWLKRRW